MGTNFYAHYNICSCCERHDTLHIGKSSGGLQAHRQQNWMSGPVTPVGEILSWQDWRRFFAEVPHEVWDEYGHMASDVTVISMFESQPPDFRSRQFNAIKDNHPTLLPHYWLDDDGFTVCSLDFS